MSKRLLGIGDVYTYDYKQVHKTRNVGFGYYDPNKVSTTSSTDGYVLVDGVLSVVNEDGSSEPGPDPYNPLGLPPYTIRTRWTEDYTPTITGVAGAIATQVSAEPNIWDITYESTTWTRLFRDSGSQNNLIEVLGANTTNVTGMGGDNANQGGLFKDCISLERVALFDTSNVKSMGYMFYNTVTGCPLTSLPLFDTGNVTSMDSMLYRCNNLTAIPLFDTVNVISMNSFASYCSSLTNIPLFNTSRLKLANNMFKDCSNVESGALALYTQMSSQGTVKNHTQTFTNCGVNTETGSAELAQIPTSWGGTGA